MAKNNKKNLKQCQSEKETYTEFISRQKIIFFMLIIVNIILLISSSYAFFTNNNEKQNIINFQTGNLNMQINSSTDYITQLNGKLPESDQNGIKNSTPIIFTLTNTGSISIEEYNVKLINEEGKISTLDEKYIKYAISLDKGVTYSSPEILSNTNNIIYTSYDLAVGESQTIFLKIWINESADINSLNKTYYGSIKVDLFQKKQSYIHINNVLYKENLDANITASKITNISDTNLSSTINLSSTNSNSFITYDVTILNNTMYDAKLKNIENIIYDNENIEYELIGFNIGDSLKSQEEITFQIKFYYKNGTLASNNVLNSVINFVFAKAHLITYSNLAGNTLPKYAIEGEDLSITFTNNIPDNVQVYRDDELTDDYTYNDNVLFIPNVEGKIKIVGFVPSPNLSGDLIPVRYNGADWIIVSESSEWYDYAKQEWANAVILKTDVSKEIGDVVDLENDVKGIFVWIPRYEYKFSDTSDEIYINFITPDDITASSGYILPDAFTFGQTNVDGIWLGKFETSMDANQEIFVIPNAIAVNEQTVNEQYNLALSFNDNFNSDNIDTHMAKNSEWGVAAYLSQSIYGKFGNSNYTLDNKEIYVNNSLNLYTGRSGGSPNPEGSDEGTYEYNEGFVNGTQKSGIGASTTGNIYGIYDMNGGAYEYVMGYLTTANSTFGATNSGYNAAGFTLAPNSKYYDAYNSISSISTPYNSHALFETKGLYNDGSIDITGENPWYIRGGVADGGNDSGIFSYGIASGYKGAYATFRISLIITE